MARSTGKDHARINLDIWGDDDWLELSPAAQHLYFTLWTSPQLSYCGTGDWHPGKIAARARGWTPADVEAAGAELSRALFLIIDTDTDEFLLRSWMKHDGLWRTPNMAVSMANARADLASRTLRSAIVFEAKKLQQREPESKAWERDSVAKMLDQKALDPASIPPYNPGGNPDANPVPNGGGNPDAMGYGHPRANPGANPGRTPAPAPPPAPFSNGGYVSPEGHQRENPDAQPPPTRYCPDHPNGTPDGCLECQHHREAFEHQQRQSRQAAIDARRAELEQNAIDRAIEIAECGLCDDDGYRGAVVCDHREHSTAEGRAAAMAALRGES